MKLSDHKQQLANQECLRLTNELTGVLAVVVASVDGFDVASTVTKELDPARIAAMSSSISAIGSVVSQEASIGISESITVKTAKGFVVITTINIDGIEYILNVVASESAILAQVVYQCNQMKAALEEQIHQSVFAQRGW